MTHPALTPGSVAVVTGGAAGIGLAAAKRFAGLGLRVAIADLGADRLAGAAEELAALSAGGADDVMTLETDVSRIDDVRRLEAAVRQRFGGTDVLMNNAGIQPRRAGAASCRRFAPASRRSLEQQRRAGCRAFAADRTASAAWCR
jgi:NAD(P)-dependent dehydrogenase (short-subunit alcohol dehydrogenase family)